MPRRSLVALAAVLAGAAPVAADEPPPLTQTTPLTPTGAIVPAGHVERVQALTAFYHQLALGLGGGVELRAGFPGLPVPALGADLELRYAPLAAGRFALVLGAGGTAEWIGGADLWLGGSVTLAWREPRWSLHTTVRTAAHVAHADHLGLATVGVTARTGATLWFAELGEVAWQAPAACPLVAARERGDAAVSCARREVGQGAWVGVWWGRGEVRGGISALVVRASGLTLPILPLLAFAWDYDL